MQHSGATVRSTAAHDSRYGSPRTVLGEASSLDVDWHDGSLSGRFVPTRAPGNEDYLAEDYTHTSPGPAASDASQVSSSILLKLPKLGFLGQVH